MLYEKNTKFPVELEEDGMVVDFVDNQFVLVIKDQSWSAFEIQALYKHRLTLAFVYERVCAIFLLTIHDAIDTSDAAFDIHNCDQANVLLEMQDPYDMEIYFVDQTHTICASRRISFSKAMSDIIKEKLLAQHQMPYDDEGFDRALAKIQGTSEPFELEPMALCQASF